MTADRGPAATSPMRLRLMAAAIAALTAAVLCAAPEAQRRGTVPSRPVGPPTPATGLKGGDGLARVYELILDARFPQIGAELRRACGPAPPEACQVLDATALWWRIQLDPDSRAIDAEFSALADKAIEATEAWIEREPSNAEAWFYAGGAYAARVQWRVLREEKLAAARDGKRIKEVLERALALEPGLDDAHFGIGMYRYYADVAPAAARVLRFLLMLPGGNRKEGPRADAQDPRARGGCCREKPTISSTSSTCGTSGRRGARSQLLRDLHQRYPGNPLFLTQIAEIEDVYEHDITASLEAWRTLLTAARTDRLNAPAIAEVRARLGIARQLDALAETDRAIEELERVVALKPDAPYSSLAQAYLRLGEAHDRLNARADAMAAYRLASVNVPDRDPQNIRKAAADRLRKAPNARHAEAFRLSLDGWRKLEQKNVAGGGGGPRRGTRPQPARSGRALPLRPRAPRPPRAGRGAGRVRPGDPRGTAVPAADPRQRLSRRGAASRARGTHGARARRLSDRLHALRRVGRNASPCHARDRAAAEVASARMIDAIDRRSDRLRRCVDDRAAAGAARKAVQVFDFSCTLCLTLNFSHP